MENLKTGTFDCVLFLLAYESVVGSGVLPSLGTLSAASLGMAWLLGRGCGGL